MKNSKHFLKTLLILPFLLLSGCSLIKDINSSASSTTSMDFSITINNGEEVDLIIGETLQLDINYQPIESYELMFTSSDENVASVSDQGLIKANNVGQATITVTYNNNSDSIIVNVLKDESFIQITNSEDPLNVTLFDSAIISYITSDDIENVNAISSNESIVSIVSIYDDFVEISADNVGSAVITIYFDAFIFDEITINVYQNNDGYIEISLDKSSIMVDESILINIDVNPIEYQNDVVFNVLKGNDLITLEGNTITANKSGEVQIQASCHDLVSNILTLTIYDFKIELTNSVIELNDHERLRIINYDGSRNNLHGEALDNSIISFGLSPVGDIFVNGDNVGKTSFYLYDDNGLFSNTIDVEVISGDPYAGISMEEFYSSYTRSDSYIDSTYRSQHNFMSGDIVTPDDVPTVASNQPTSNGLLIHNSDKNYSSDGNTYTVEDKNGNKAFDIYYGGAYITLEEVAAYIYAFGDIPINYIEDNEGYPSSSPWGKYLRLNHSQFYGWSDSYEPELPNITGCGGNLVYYELDIGTTGTDTGPQFPNRIYNDGNKITRGAARIVYSKYYLSSGLTVDDEDRYVFYTYNHYNDFQEYLNYENGWGYIFGNITAGNDQDEYNRNNPPTPYIEVVRQEL